MYLINANNTVEQEIVGPFETEEQVKNFLLCALKQGDTWRQIECVSPADYLNMYPGYSEMETI